ncbi:integrase domain-containing protein [Serratia fonticola]|uniref:integrase domain-containing protein n=1 Tax=Serratia fonticola TaxID=47917 RepID=UPI002DBE2D63|nr:integrase domain-containing protein [Serratia fonticola]MEB7884353.1 integrase domain-containing protein [Serratia fonticola]
MGRLKQEMTRLAYQAGGSFKTVHDRITIAKRLSDNLYKLNIQIHHVKHLKAKHIVNYIQDRLAQGVGKRTLQNEMAAIRAILQRAGREKLAQLPIISNQALGLSQASREGTHRAIAAEHYQQVLAQAEKIDKGFACALELAYQMGLRSQEAVQCHQSLNTWLKALERGDARLLVTFGTKGSRPRITLVLNPEQLKQTLQKALAIMQQQKGKLIDKPDLKSAMAYWRRTVTKVGLKGVYSPHSLRYAWAQRALQHYQTQGFSHKESLALVSMDLGHGDGRGRYVERVYGLSDT